jgi:ABC-type dipeptide/oligopeptide/nickel transport system ATPase component
VAVIRAGAIVEVAAVRDFFARPQHPYSRTLLAAATFRLPGQPGAGSRGS